MRKLLLTILPVLLLAASAFGQSRQVTGVVSGADGNPIAGVTVVVEGVAGGASTGMDGRYTISAPADGTLSFTFIGMEPQTIAIAGRAIVNVTLRESSEVLEDVLVIAYGTAPKETFTGSAAVISADAIGKQQVTNISKGLAGLVPGVQIVSNNGQPGTAASIRVRGIGSFTADAAPLIILDGNTYEGSLADIATSDIESMTVLKDAAASSLYGARAANGVIIITTKRARSREAVVSFDAKLGVNSRALPDYDIVTDPGQYYEVYWGALKRYAQIAGGYDNAQASAYASNNLITGTNMGLVYNVYNVPNNEVVINGKLNPNARLGNVVNGNYLYPDSWFDEAYTQGKRQEYNVSVSNSTDKSNSYFSLGYLEDEGYVVASDYKRLSARLRTESQMKSWLKMGGSASYVRSTYNQLLNDGSTGDLFYMTRNVAPIYPVYIRDAQGNILTGPKGYKRYDYGEGDQGGLARPAASGANPISAYLYDEDSGDVHTYSLNGFAEISFLKNFKLNLSGATDMRDSRRTNYTNSYFGQYADSNGMLYKYHDRTSSYTLRQLLTWAWSCDSHNIQAMAAHEYYNTRYQYIYGTKQNGFSVDGREISMYIDAPQTNSYSTEYMNEGYFGRVNYDYAGKYFVEGSYRRDASSRFASNNWWGNFWSLSAGWLIDREDFFNVPWVDHLKLKASYGALGNDRIGDYRYTNRYDIVNAGGMISATLNAKGNPNIGWESNHTFNAGVEFSLLGNRLNGGVEYFYRVTQDLLFSRTVAPSMGYGSYYDNIGRLDNWGVELDLSGLLVDTRNITWTANLNATWFRNELKSLPPERQDGFETGIYKVMLGGTRYQIFIPEYAGVYKEAGANQGKPMWYKDVKDNNGNVTGRETTLVYGEATKYDQGTALPDFYGGFGTQLRVYGFDFGISFAYQLGGQVYDSGYVMLLNSPTSDRGRGFHKDLLKAWTPENPDSNYPRFVYGDTQFNGNSDRFLVDASYLSLQNISVGYTLPEKWTSKIGVRDVRLFFVADNVALWSKRQGLDPRQTWDGSNSGARYAPIRTVSGGISLKF